jgi:hypothetical protein
MKKIFTATFIGLVMVALVATLAIAPALALIPCEGEDSDNGYHGSYAWAYLYANLNPRTWTYSGIQHDHYYTFGSSGYWKVDLLQSNDIYHPYTETRVWWSPNNINWYLDADALVIF